MFRRPGIISFYCSIILSFLLGCNRNSGHPKENTTIDTLMSYEIEEVDNFSSVSNTKIKVPKSDSIVGDTVWVNPYANKTWADTITTNGYTASFLVWIDTTDYIIDTVRSSKGDRIVIGFNHYYQINFEKGNKHWFSITLDKKKDFGTILEGTDSWLESNLNVFKNLLYNKKFEQFIVEFSINSHSNFGSLYYIVFNAKGEKKYIGTANSWGGEGPDGEPFLSENDELFMTCFEVYNFNSSSAMTLSEFVAIAESRSKSDLIPEFTQIHGLRNLSNNNFLAVFNRFHGEPEFNAFILNTDTSMISKFSYFGMVEEMDAILLYTEDQVHKRSFLYDTEREKLICITKSPKPKIYELSIDVMRKYPDDTCSSGKYSTLDFNLYGAFEFYINSNDTIVYVKTEEND
jgi:hypothetical protein